MNCLCFSFDCFPLITFIVALQNDDIKVYDDQLDYWKTVWVSNDIAVKHGWRNSKILKAYSPGLGKLSASVSYPVGSDDKKEVIILFLNLFL